jgi:sulfoquinovosyltransferase
MHIPLVMSYHTHLPQYGKKYANFVSWIDSICWAVLRGAHSCADLTLLTSYQMKDGLVSHEIPRVEVWRKGIDIERFSPSFHSIEMGNMMTDGNPEDFLVVSVGRLGAEKRLKDIKQMLEKIPNARLCIVGNGPQEEELNEHFKGTKTVFTGQLSGDELSRAFASADAFVMPSDSETLGFVVIESMASGVPVVGANAGGIPHLIDDGDTGFLVPPGDIERFVQHLKILEDDNIRIRMGKRAREEAERWGWEAATSVLRNVQYDQALINFQSRGFNKRLRLLDSNRAWRLMGGCIRGMLKAPHRLFLTLKHGVEFRVTYAHRT